MTYPQAQIVRSPAGQWVAVAALPFGTGIFTVREMMDEGPVRMSVLHRMSAVIGPQLRAEQERHAQYARDTAEYPERADVHPGIAGVPDEAVIGRTIEFADRAADALVDREVRQELLGRLGEKVKAVLGFAREIYNASGARGDAVGYGPVAAVAGAIGGATPNDLIHVAIGHTIALLAQNDQRTYAIVLDRARRIPADQNSVKFISELIQHTAGTPVAQALFTLFRSQGLERLAAVVAAASAGGVR